MLQGVNLPQVSNHGLSLVIDSSKIPFDQGRDKAVLCSCPKRDKMDSIQPSQAHVYNTSFSPSDDVTLSVISPVSSSELFTPLAASGEIRLLRLEPSKSERP